MDILIIAKDGTSSALEHQPSCHYMLQRTIERDFVMSFHISPAVDRVIVFVSNFALLSGLVLGAAMFANMGA
jgi:hypothetical protein